MSHASAMLVKTAGLDVTTPQGRPLFQDLSMEIPQDKVAMIGRNGVGKTSLLRILAGEIVRPEVILNTSPWFVRQNLGCPGKSLQLARKTLNGTELMEAGLSPDVLRQDACSPGEQRKLHLLMARTARPELLILDEPTSDLDEHGIDWLRGWLAEWSRGLLLVSHHRTLLRQFQHFFVIAESGCRYVSGDLKQVEECLETDAIRNQRQYVNQLNTLLRREERNERVNNRHDRKKNRGTTQ